MAVDTSIIPLADFATAATKICTLPVAVGDGGLGAFIRGIGSGNERIRGGKKAILDIRRFAASAATTEDSIDGTIGVWGLDLPDPLSNKPVGNAFATAQAQTCAVFKAVAQAKNASTNTFNCTDTGLGTGLGISAGAADNPTSGTFCQVADTTFLATKAWVCVLNGVILPYNAGVPTASDFSFGVSAGVVTIYTKNDDAAVIADGADVAIYLVAAPTQVLADGAHRFERQQITSRKAMFVVPGTAQTEGRTLVTLEHAVE
jgi:hypothetical protein